VLKWHAKKGHGPCIKANAAHNSPRNTCHEIIIFCAALSETTGVASVVEGAKEVGNTVGERTLGDHKLGLKMGHAFKCLKVIGKFIETTHGKRFTKMRIADRHSEDANTIVDNW